MSSFISVLDYARQSKSRQERNAAFISDALASALDVATDLENLVDQPASLPRQPAFTASSSVPTSNLGVSSDPGGVSSTLASDAYRKDFFTILATEWKSEFPSLFPPPTISSSTPSVTSPSNPPHINGNNKIKFGNAMADLTSKPFGRASPIFQGMKHFDSLSLVKFVSRRS